jgi:hypothetical protein
MALDDSEVVVAAVGYLYVNDTLGAVAPTPDEIDDFDPNTFGGKVVTLKITGTPTGGTFTVSVDGTPSSAIAYNASKIAIQNAIEAIDGVGAGNTSLTGTSISDGTGLDLTISGGLLGEDPTVTASATSLTGGTTPAVTVTVKTASNGWVNLGHSSRTKLPEFGYDGGKLEMKGSWQKQRLRRVWGAQPIEDSVKVQLEQWNRRTLELYFGADVAETDGVYGVSGDWTPVEKAFLVVLVDQEVNLGCYASKASIARDAAVEIPIDDFSTLPIEASFLNMGTRRLYDWISNDLIGPVPA